MELDRLSSRPHADLNDLKTLLDSDSPSDRSVASRHMALKATVQAAMRLLPPVIPQTIVHALLDLMPWLICILPIHALAFMSQLAQTLTGEDSIHLHTLFTSAPTERALTLAFDEAQNQLSVCEALKCRLALHRRLRKAAADCTVCLNANLTTLLHQCLFSSDTEVRCAAAMILQELPNEARDAFSLLALHASVNGQSSSSELLSCACSEKDDAFGPAHRWWLKTILNDTDSVIARAKAEAQPEHAHALLRLALRNGDLTEKEALATCRDDFCLEQRSEKGREFLSSAGDRMDTEE